MKRGYDEYESNPQNHAEKQPVAGGFAILKKEGSPATGPMLITAATVGLQAQAIALPAKSHAYKTYQALGAPTDRLEIKIDPATVKYMADAMRHSAWYFIVMCRSHSRTTYTIIAPKN